MTAPGHTPQLAPAAGAAPLSLRLAAGIYEAILILAIALAAALPATLLRLVLHRIAGGPSASVDLVATGFTQILVLAAVGAYFILNWTRGGQTLAMKTWRLKVIMRDGRALGVRTAIWRYFALIAGALPGLALASALGASPGAALAWFGVGVALVMASALLHPQRMLPQDWATGTQVVRLAARQSTQPPHSNRSPQPPHS